MTDSPLLVPVGEAAKLLGIGKNTAYDLVRSGELPAVSIGRRRLVLRSGLAEWAERAARNGERGP